MRIDVKSSREIKIPAGPCHVSWCTCTCTCMRMQMAGYQYHMQGGASQIGALDAPYELTHEVYVLS